MVFSKVMLYAPQRPEPSPPQIPMLKPEGKLALDAALAELNKATQELQRIEHDPAMSLAALSKAAHRYELSQLEGLRCHWQLRLADAHALPQPSLAAGPIVIIGGDKAVRESLAVLLDVKGYGRSKVCGFDSWHKYHCTPSQVIVLDVSGFSRDAATWFVESFDTAIGRPPIIALAWPQDAPRFKDKADEVIIKPAVFEELLRAIDRINSKVEAMNALRMTTCESFDL